MPEVVTFAPRVVVPLTERFVTPLTAPPSDALPVIASALLPPASVDDVVTVVPASVASSASVTASP